MTTATTIITSDHRLDDVEHPFRVTAGPGAGKTFWLANHIRHVARISQRLTPCSRIGVISYTNVAVREILGRLGTAADIAEVATIHSFLFRHVVRPYLHLLKTSSGEPLVAHELVDTHSEHFVAHNHLDAWLGQFQRRQLLIPAWKTSLELLRSRLRMLAVRIDASGQAYYAPCKSEARDSGIRDLLVPERLLAYKRQYWLQGSVDHEDVLYLAHRLLREFPALRSFLSARFPYLFIDEFQDTLPVQASLVRWLAERGTVVGVIGDPEQAIYGFLDASPTHFHGFQLAGHRCYRIEGNHRSTGQIVTLANRLRSDGLQQATSRTEAGIPPCVYVGDLSSALAEARQHSIHSASMLVLARNHAEVRRARRPDAAESVDPWEPLEQADAGRFRFILHLASAVDLAQRQFFDIAIQRLVQGISSRARFREPLKYDRDVHLQLRRSLALSLLEFMLTQDAGMRQKSVLDVYRELGVFVEKCIPGLRLAAVKTGKFCAAASACLYGELVSGLKTAEETRLTRTIHQAKGSEAPAVFVVLQEDSIDHLLRPTADNEEQRITYVALSRARDELHLYCPIPDRLAEFTALGVKTVNVGGSLTPVASKTRSGSRPSRKK